MAMLPLRSYAPGLVALCLLSLGGPLRAAADGRSPPSRAPDPDPKHVSARDAADSLERAADKATSEYRHSDAADIYGRAWDTYRDPRYICNRGSLLLSLKRHIEAAEALHTCIKASKGEYGAVGTAIERLFTRARAPICTLEVTTNVLGAEITVAGKVVGKDPLDAPLFLEAGNYIVSATAAHYDLTATKIECPAGKWHPIALELAPSLKPGEVMEAPAPAPKNSTVVLTPRGVVMSTDPRSSPLFAAPSSPEPQASSRNVFAIAVGSGVTLAGAGLAIGSFVVASGYTADADNLSSAIAKRDPTKACDGLSADSQCVQVSEKRLSATQFMAVGMAGSVFAAGGIAVTIYGFVGGDSSNRPASAALAVKPAPGGGWLGMSGRF